VTRVVFRMQLHTCAEHFENVVNRGITAAIEAVVKHLGNVAKLCMLHTAREEEGGTYVL
jgi:hypothetical protein